MHGLGNDFVVIDARDGRRPVTPRWRARSATATAASASTSWRWCGRGTGWRPRSTSGTPTARRPTPAATPPAASRGMLMAESGAAALELRTGRGVLRAEDAGGGLTRVNMGPPQLDLGARCRWRGRWTSTRCRSTATRARSAWATRIASSSCRTPRRWTSPGSAARIEHDPLFPERTNVEFVQVLDRETIRMRVWERGGMITLACGSGACAAAVVTARRGLTGRRVTVRLDGGRARRSTGATTASG